VLTGVGWVTGPPNASPGGHAVLCVLLLAVAQLHMDWGGGLQVAVECVWGGGHVSQALPALSPAPVGASPLLYPALLLMRQQHAAKDADYVQYL
jgi:hypothetical protein